MALHIPSIDDVRHAEPLVREHVSPAPLIRSYPLEKELGLSGDRRVWLKDYGWTPVGSFKLLGALNWMAHNREAIGDRPVAAHSSGNFASGVSFAGSRFGKRVIIVMPDTAAKVKFERTRSFGAEIRTYNIARDHETGERDRLTRDIAEQENAVQASPYDDRYVIAGNGVGGLAIVEELKRQGRALSQFVCQVSGGGLMAGHALAIADGFPDASIVGVEPENADDFRQSLAAGERVRLERPTSICDGLLSYDVGEHNWPILKTLVARSVVVPDAETRQAMKWLYEQHGLRTEPSGAIATAALLTGKTETDGNGDIVVVVSGRNVDEDAFREWIDAEFLLPDFFFDLGFGHFVNEFDRHRRVFFAVLDKHGPSARFDRFRDCEHHLIRKRELVVNVDEQHEVDGIRFQLGRLLGPLVRHDVGDAEFLHPHFQSVEHLLLHVDGDDFPFVADFLGHQLRNHTAAGTDVGDDVARFQLEAFDEHAEFFFLFAGFAFEPARAGETHHVGDFPPHVELADAVGVVKSPRGVSGRGFLVVRFAGGGCSLLGAGGFRRRQQQRQPEGQQQAVTFRHHGISDRFRTGSAFA
eukprot:g5274.t1